MRYGVEKFKNSLSISSETGKDRVMKFSGMIDFSIEVCNRWLSMPAVPSGRHKKKKRNKNFKDNTSNQNLYLIIWSIFKCPKQMTQPEVEVSTAGYFKNRISNSQFSMP
jgi:hypothetical protein